jgi:hypothetical protein
MFLEMGSVGVKMVTLYAPVNSVVLILIGVVETRALIVPGVTVITGVCLMGYMTEIHNHHHRHHRHHRHHHHHHQLLMFLEMGSVGVKMVTLYAPVNSVVLILVGVVGTGALIVPGVTVMVKVRLMENMTELHNHHR